MTPIHEMTRRELAEEALRIRRDRKNAKSMTEHDRLTRRYTLVLTRIGQLDRMEAERGDAQ